MVFKWLTLALAVAVGIGFYGDSGKYVGFLLDAVRGTV